MQPIIFVGTQRSGSNLLRLMLNAHTQIAAPHPPHILQSFAPLLNRYGGLSKKENFEQLARDVCDFVSYNPVPWNLKLDAGELAEKCPNQTLVSLFVHIYQAYARQHGKSYWCCKSMANLYYIPEIEREMKPFYIHLVRDGRDVAASFKKAVVGEKHIYHLATQWKQDQDTAEQYCQNYASERYIPVLYENLIHDPENTLRILLHRLGLEFEPGVMRYNYSDEAKKTAEAGKMWDNVKKPVMQNNSNKFITQLSEEDILIFESVAGSVLERHGYTPYFDSARRKEGFTDEELDVFSKQNEELKINALKSFDPEGVEKRKAQAKLVNEIKQRPVQIISSDTR